LIRAYPGWYRSNSVYTLFPLTIPSENRAIFKARGIEDEYTYDPPRFIPPPTPVTTWQGVVDVLANTENYKVTAGPHVFELIKHDWMLSGDKPWNFDQKKICLHALYGLPQGLAQIHDFYRVVTDNLIKTKSIKLRDRYQVDMVRDVAIPSHAIVTAHIFRIPLDNQGGELTPTELYEAMATVFQYTFLDIDTAKTLAVKAAAKLAVKKLAAAVTKSCTEVSNGDLSFLESIFMRPDKGDAALPGYGTKLVQRLFDADMSLDEVIWTIIPTAAAAAPIQSQGIARLLDFYLSPENANHWADIQAIATSDAPEDLEKLRKYALEAFRLSPAAAGALRIVASSDATIRDGDKILRPAAGSAIFPDFNTAGLDPAVFPDPEQIKLDRADDLYLHHGWGQHACLGRNIVMGAMAVQLRSFARLKNLRRAAGPAGQLKSKVTNGAFKVFMNEDWSDWTPFPSTWKLYYDM
jgi:hypothetical protein